MDALRFFDGTLHSQMCCRIYLVAHCFPQIILLSLYEVSSLMLYYFIIVDVPLWIETEGAVQHVKDYIVHYKLTPPSASSSSAVHGDELDSDDEEAEEEEEGGDVNVLKSGDEDRTSGGKNKKRKSNNGDEEGDESEEGDVEDEDEDAEREEENSDFEMFAGMFDTAIEMAAEEDSK